MPDVLGTVYQSGLLVAALLQDLLKSQRKTSWQEFSWAHINCLLIECNSLHSIKSKADKVLGYMITHVEDEVYASD